MAIEGTRIWRYIAEGVIPAGVNVEAGQLEAVVRSNVSWGDPVLGLIRGTTVTVVDITPDELARRSPGLHIL